LFFYYFDDGRVLLIHLLLRNAEGNCFFDSATATNCRLIEEKTTMQIPKNRKYF
jgi:hypothetical protein